ncbi:unnamed protein product [Mytilus coruscus]|uniref:Reverse transcriptase/retrotransposon-derived protein RNase H-like domain-containing protein n=1 Tax=Mytilus coruscus TaxID=42192 RepID=A0A6J8DZW5_MYTCO|nr:unnamed protein product [Mytilus coruscus]
MIEPSVRLFDEKNIAILPAVLQTSTENKVVSLHNFNDTDVKIYPKMKLGDSESYYEKNSTAVCCTEISLDENPGESNLPEYLKELWERSCMHLNENEKNCEEAFTKLKEVLTSAPILGYPIIGSKFILETDASDKALGAVLSQEQDGQEIVIAYMSKAMTKTEQSYCVTRKELLAVVCALRHFHSYLYGQPILIRTDNSAVSWMRNLKAPTGQVARWLQELGTYDLTVVHRPGLKHRNADALSRNPCASCSRQESVNNAHDSCDEDSEEKEHLSVRTVTRSKADTSPTRNQFVLLGWDVNTLRQQQLQDKIIGQLFIKFEDKETKPEWNSLSEESTTLKTLWNMWDRFEIYNGVLYVNWIDNLEQTHLRLVVPESYKYTVLKYNHDTPSAGHLDEISFSEQITFQDGGGVSLLFGQTYKIQESLGVKGPLQQISQTSHAGHETRHTIRRECLLPCCASGMLQEGS